MQDIKIGQKSRIRIWISNQQFHGLRAPDDAFFHWNFWAWPDKLGRYILGHFRQIYQHPFGTVSPLSKVFINQPLFLQKKTKQRIRDFSYRKKSGIEYQLRNPDKYARWQPFSFQYVIRLNIICFRSLWIAPKGQCKDERTFRSSSSAPTDYGGMMISSQVSTEQIHIPIPNRKYCKTYENLSFLQKKWLSNVKSLSRDTQNLSRNFDPKYPSVQYAILFFCQA